MSVPNAKSYKGFSDLVKKQVRGRDFQIVVSTRPPSRVAIIAVHGGLIEYRTSEIARAIAGNDFHLYLFEGMRASQNYRTLHLTSHLFDEPECLSLIATCPFVVAIHGCTGTDEKVLIGGRDVVLKEQLSLALCGAGVAVQLDGHAFPAADPRNICNRGKTRRGVQLELTRSLRGTAADARVVGAIRSVLTALDSSV